MVHKLLAAGICLALAIIAGCSDGDGDPSSEPTGIAAVDAAIDAIERQDADALLAQVRLSAIPCTVPQNDRWGVSSCSSESPTFEAFPVGGCRDTYVSRSVAEAALSSGILPLSKIPGLHEIYDAAGSRVAGGFFAPANATHVVLLASRTDGDEIVAGLVFDEESLVGIADACTWQSPFIAYWQLTSSFYPLPTPTPRPTPMLTGVVSIDAVVDAIRARDSDSLVEQIQLSPIPCYPLARQNTPFPRCDGEPDGTLFERFALLERFAPSYCASVYVSQNVAEQTIGDFIATASGYVYAVYGTAESLLEQGDGFSADFFRRASPSYIAIVEHEVKWDRTLAVMLLLNDHGLVGYSSGCDDTPESFISFWELTDAIIPPPDER